MGTVGDRQSLDQQVNRKPGLICHHGRHQEKDAGHEGREGQCHGQVRYLRGGRQGCKTQG